MPILFDQPDFVWELRRKENGVGSKPQNQANQ